MLLHLGEDRYVRLDEVVAILDYRLFAGAAANRDFLQLSRSERRLEGTCELAPETAVIADDRVVLSPLSRQTLARRASAGLERRNRSYNPSRLPGPP